MGSLHNIDFGVFWASLREGTGFRDWVTGFAVPGNQFRVTRIRVSMGSNRFCGSKKPGSGHQGSGFRRLRAREFEGFGVRWVPTG